MSLPDGWEMVVGLEVHVELATSTKLFCGCPNQFGAEPNTNVCPVCLGLPGSLPVLNERALELAATLATALGCSVVASEFARKNYFYPDMPKNYQITQYDRPLAVDGAVELPDGHVVRVERLHLEEDTGKSVHVGGSGRIHEAVVSLEDYNRAGVPLVEIVSRPDIRSAEQARWYVEELRGIILATGASDARMEEGSLRVDANVSVRKAGSSEFGVRCEVKNLNSLRSLVRALEHEAARQVSILSSGGSVRQQTLHWDEQAGRTRPGRSKEEAEDYRYFPDPDLPPLEPDPEWLGRLRERIPPLPAERRRRLADLLGVPTERAKLVVERGLDELVASAAAAGGDPELLLVRAENDLTSERARALDPAQLALLVNMERDGKLTPNQSRAVLSEMVDSGDPVDVVVQRMGVRTVDPAELEEVVERVIAENSSEWNEFVAGDAKRRGKLTGFFVGKVMKATRGQADGKLVSEILLRKASGLGSERE
ncbi:MAG: aspartyl/glutamyl-tRNA(Asn/Gln) amidotransferase subunit B [Acidimicrobiales bacterium]|nr:MAG: aspartyl/glutamyl-tRNA(Asn/Gln) amidotransferase subunit B [Acidimicrobiales bacterium]